MKKIFTIIFLSIISFNVIHAEITWNLSDDGTLTISGTGDMENYSEYNTPAPWKSSKITKIIIEDGITSISNYAFFDCTNLTSIIIPNSVTSIGDYAFCCTALTSITIPNNTTSIGNYAFYCTNLTSITIPNGITNIGNYAFAACKGMTSIKVEDENANYESSNNCNAIIHKSDNTLVSGCKNTIIPNNVTFIGEGAFCGHENLTSITIPNSVISFGRSAFEGCSGITNITIPNSVVSIGYSAFSGCI